MSNARTLVPIKQGQKLCVITAKIIPKAPPIVLFYVNLFSFIMVIYCQKEYINHDKNW